MALEEGHCSTQMPSFSSDPSPLHQFPLAGLPPLTPPVPRGDDSFAALALALRVPL